MLHNSTQTPLAPSMPTEKSAMCIEPALLASSAAFSKARMRAMVRNSDRRRSAGIGARVLGRLSLCVNADFPFPVRFT